eukprot:comp21585_c0_seq3/m.47451 comp21585_c0_seq3/g.47451  ORF comp21585_c0_seq3/g.47451 comp21585_c0_seq3/m.47451 type:complete len:251 (+) comp21585_c0_seq3:1423-2175(+)
MDATVVFLPEVIGTTTRGDCLVATGAEDGRSTGDRLTDADDADELDSVRVRFGGSAGFETRPGFRSPTAPIVLPPGSEEEEDEEEDAVEFDAVIGSGFFGVAAFGSADPIGAAERLVSDGGVIPETGDGFTGVRCGLLSDDVFVAAARGTRPRCNATGLVSPADFACRAPGFDAAYNGTGLTAAEPGDTLPPAAAATLLFAAVAAAAAADFVVGETPKAGDEKNPGDERELREDRSERGVKGFLEDDGIE